MHVIWPFETLLIIVAIKMAHEFCCYVSLFPCAIYDKQRGKKIHTTKDLNIERFTHNTNWVDVVSDGGVVTAMRRTIDKIYTLVSINVLCFNYQNTNRNCYQLLFFSTETNFSAKYDVSVVLDACIQWISFEIDCNMDGMLYELSKNCRNSVDRVLAW